KAVFNGKVVFVGNSLKKRVLINKITEGNQDSLFNTIDTIQATFRDRKEANYTVTFCDIASQEEHALSQTFRLRNANVVVLISDVKKTDDNNAIEELNHYFHGIVQKVSENVAQRTIILTNDKNGVASQKRLNDICKWCVEEGCMSCVQASTKTDMGIGEVRGMILDLLAKQRPEKPSPGLVDLTEVLAPKPK
ncbi:MAG: hypothetical protein LBJ71_03085, partial [Holosporaceae bacterium]|nr:hypothetical protein [Holosporaceae bacterium]